MSQVEEEKDDSIGQLRNFC